MKKILIVKSDSSNISSEFLHCELFLHIECIDFELHKKILQYQNLLVTSVSGAKALIRYATNQYIFSVGLKTYRFLQQNGFVNLYLPALNIKELIDSQAFTRNSILYLSGFHTAFHNYAQFSIDRYVVYKAIEKALKNDFIQGIKNGEISHVLLYSQRSAEVFLKNFEQYYRFPNTTFVCISKSVANVLQKSCDQVLYTGIPNEEEMFRILNQL